MPAWVTFELARVRQRGIVGDEHGDEPVSTFTDSSCLSRASLGSMHGLVRHAAAGEGVA